MEYDQGGNDKSELIAFHKQRLAAYYAQFAPDKVALVGELIPRYAETEGGLDHMWKTLRTKYGSIPSDVLSDSLPPKGNTSEERAPLLHEPATTPVYPPPSAQSPSAVNSELISADALTSSRRSAGPGSEKSEPRVRFKEGPDLESSAPPTATTIDPQLYELHRQRLRRYYQYYYLPRKLNKLDESLLSKCTTPEMLDKMWENLEATYGREKDIPTATDEIWEMEKRKAAERQRLEKYFQHYLPMRMQDLVEAMVDKSLSRHGSFDEMWEYLEATYGPESDVQPPQIQPQTSEREREPVRIESMASPTLRVEAAVQCRDFHGGSAEVGFPKQKNVTDASTSVDLERNLFWTTRVDSPSRGYPSSVSPSRPTDPVAEKVWKWDSSWMPTGLEVGWNSLCAKSSPNSKWYQPSPDSTLLMEPHPGSGVTTSPSVSLYAQTPAERLHFGLSPTKAKTNRGGMPISGEISPPPAFHGSKMVVDEDEGSRHQTFPFDPHRNIDWSIPASSVPSQALTRCQTISSPSRTPRPSIATSGSLY